MNLFTSLLKSWKKKLKNKRVRWKKEELPPSEKLPIAGKKSFKIYLLKIRL